VIAADIARRLGVSRQRVGILAQHDDFPRPIGVLGRSSVWRWASVERWARDTGRLPPAS
jgi:predicted DNA-binding transcriptional regulator AlpA